MIRAATGKDGKAAESESVRKGAAGDVLQYLIEQSYNDVRLLDPDTNRTLHLYEIHAAPESTWALLAGLLQDNSWTMKDTKAARGVKSELSLSAFAKRLGKDGQAAKQEAMRKGEAGEVLQRLIEKQSVSVDTLLDPDTNRTLHLVEINSAPEETQELITSLVLENTWSVKDTKAAVFSKGQGFWDSLPL